MRKMKHLEEKVDKLPYIPDMEKRNVPERSNIIKNILFFKINGTTELENQLLVCLDKNKSDHSQGNSNKQGKPHAK